MAGPVKYFTECSNDLSLEVHVTEDWSTPAGNANIDKYQ